MDDEVNEIKECYAYFGRAMYSAQVLEKAMLNCLLFTHVPNITKERYDELLAEKSQLTFGQLKQEVILMGLCDEEFISALDKFHAKRDWLAHNYWWDRTIEFDRRELRHKILKELEDLFNEFENLNDLVEERLRTIMAKHGLEFEKLVEKFRELESTPQTPEYRKLTKNETLLNIFIYESAPNSQIPIFKLGDNSYWSLCEIGLTSFAGIKSEEKLISLEKTKGIFPVLQFNPRPKVNQVGEYELDLKKNGLYMKIERIVTGNKFLYNWAIRKK